MFARLVLGCVALGSSAVAASTADLSALASENDMRRARTKVPGDYVRGHGHEDMVETLNRVLISTPGLHTKPCHAFRVEQLIDLQRTLHGHRDPKLQSVYAEQSDNRRMMAFGLEGDELVALEATWARELALLAKYPALEEVSRDAKCHEAVMWMVHHVPYAKQLQLRKSIVLPLLPPRRQAAPDRALETAPAAAVADVMNGYLLAVGCTACHSTDSSTIFPPPVLPFFPHVFSADTYGFEDFLNRDPLAGGHKNYTATFYYDWPNNRHLYNGTEVVTSKEGYQWTSSYTRLWWGPTSAAPDLPVNLCDINTTLPGKPVCTCSAFPKPLISCIERPDGWSRAQSTFVAREEVVVDGKSIKADHWLGPNFPYISPAHFEIWTDPASNFPVKFTGPIGTEGSTGGRFYSLGQFKTFGESRVSPEIWDKVDLSICTNSTAYSIPSHLGAGPTTLLWT